MTTLEILLKGRYVQDVEPVDDFTGRIPVESTSFKLGDIFTVPTKFNVLRECIEGIQNEFILVETSDGNIRKFYPSQLSRRVFVYNADGTPRGDYVTANGTASKLYIQFDTVSEGMNALKGKTICVNGVNKVQSCFGTRTVYTFDLV